MVFAITRACCLFFRVSTGFKSNYKNNKLLKVSNIDIKTK